MIRTLLIALLLLLITACSTTRLVYSNADWLLKMRMTSNFDLDAGQQQALSKRLDRLHQWHRKQELPRYAGILETLSAHAEDGLNIAELSATVDQLETARQALALGVIPDLAAFFSELTPEQIAHYDQAFRADMEEVQELADGPLDERQQELADRFISRLQHLTGPLDFDQRKLIETRFQQLPDYQPHWLAFRMQRHQALIALLEQKPGREHIRQQLSAWWQDRQSAYPPKYRAQRQTSREAMIRLIHDVSQTLDDEQRQYLMSRLSDYRDDFLKLAAATP